MQFVAHGPDIPDGLVQAHEDGDVVFFCGAGISYPAGLPGFGGLVDDIYKHLGTACTDIEREAYENGRYDATLDLLERRIPGRRIAVRKAITQTLRPKLRRKGSTDTHEALLQLSRSREGALRLVTTNFDRIFEHVMKRSGQPNRAYAAPTLPIPKKSRWNGLVYLHGLLPAPTDESALNQLVLTSGDFGLAYLTERWAARFVSELFRNYTVCFVGYSINDTVLRYMMDALAADRMLGEITPKAYALSDCEPGQESARKVEWEAKGVTPILYEVPAGGHDHSALHRTFMVWAETYRSGLLGKERIVVNYALARPSASTRQDDFVGRMLWALSDKSGLPAKVFADFNPAPPIEWLKAFSENRYYRDDLSRFGVQSRVYADEKLRFSLIQRPAPYNLAPWMTLVSSGSIGSQWDAVMFHLARWLRRHLNDPELIIWVAEQGGQMYEPWRSMVEQELDRLAQLQEAGKTGELDEIRAQAPNAIPGPLMQPLWRVLLTGRVKSPRQDLDPYGWKEGLKRDGLTATRQLELRALLSPRVRLRKPFRLENEEKNTEQPTRIRQLVDWDLVLASDYVYSALRDVAGEPWQSVLPELLDDFQQLLCDALGLMRELGEANDRNDRSYVDLPSISPHWQNRQYSDWVALVELLREAWLATRRRSPTRATDIAQGWFDLPYPTFKRLALFAGSQPESIASEQWVNWLLAADAWWLWSVETKRETMRILVLQGSHLAPAMRDRLEGAILAGPPREMFRADIEPERWRELVDGMMWLRLAKLDASGQSLGTDAQKRLIALSGAHPKWQLVADESDEFSAWMIGTGDPGYAESRVTVIAPRKRQELVDWLRQPSSEPGLFSAGDTWRETCRMHLLNSLCALSDLAQEGVWPSYRWQEALGVWSEDRLTLRSWRYAASLVQTMPDGVLQDIVQSVTWWLDAISKGIDRNEGIMLDLCRRILDLPLEPNSGITQSGQPVNEALVGALNHPVGHIAQALLNLWFKREPNDNDGLPLDVEPLIRRLCDTQIERFRHGRVLLASRLVAFFRVDRPWAEKYLLPLFDWARNPTEARAAWAGFLWSPRLNRELLMALKSQFLETARHYADLDGLGRQFAAFLTYAALESLEGYTDEEFRIAFEVLPQEGLQEAAQALSQALEGAGDRREEYWRNRVLPFWQHVWPKSLDLVTNSIADSLARLSIAAGTEFPEVLRAVQDWLRPVEHPSHIIYRLHESGLCSQFPVDALHLLGAVIADQAWAPSELGQCLKSILAALPELQKDQQYQKLVEYSRQRGG
jgi:SIR2-like domain